MWVQDKPSPFCGEDFSPTGHGVVQDRLPRVLVHEEQRQTSVRLHCEHCEEQDRSKRKRTLCVAQDRLLYERTLCGTRRLSERTFTSTRWDIFV